MRHKSRADILFSPWFLIALALLLLNDFVLKIVYQNWITGKLSDFAGLFIFPYFFSALFPRYVKPIYISTIALFIIWNSSLSNGIINLLSGIGISLVRTIDISDFIAFTALVLSYVYYMEIIHKSNFKISNGYKLIIYCISIFAFIATTLPRRYTQLSMGSGKDFDVKMNKKEFFEKVQSRYGQSNSTEQDLNDSIFYLHYYIPDIPAEMTVLANIQENGTNTIIRVDSILTGSVTGGFFSGVDDKDLSAIESISRTKHEQFFEKYFINKLTNTNNKPRRIYYSNRKMFDAISSPEN